MKFSDEIYSVILNKYNLLNTEFYQAWSMRTLPLLSMQEYAMQYFHHEKNFPRYLSRIHSNCENEKIRQIILENLIDEEKDLENNHQKLWLDFAESVGCDKNDVINSQMNGSTKQMIDAFFACANKADFLGIIAMFCYEVQVPNIYKEKIMGLEKYYLINNKKGQKFFDIHLEMDKWHSDQWKSIIDNFTDKEKEDGIKTVHFIGKSMINFLDGIKID